MFDLEDDDKIPDGKLTKIDDLNYLLDYVYNNNLRFKFICMPGGRSWGVHIDSHKGYVINGEGTNPEMAIHNTVIKLKNHLA